ncbi:hypothetical protein QE152_g7232 [Popillia japonica]|uniref:Uncharacterized protein n=1 Tax=Popillia japonica TaxID=7064 RepID=A0AAW1MC34_POPJA
MDEQKGRTKEERDWYHHQECEEIRKEKTVAEIAWMNKKDEQRNKANGIYKRKKNEWLKRQLEEINREGNRNNLRQFYKMESIRERKMNG